MVLLSHDNPVNIKNNSLLKCLEKKKNSFNVFVIPLKEKSNDIYTINDTKPVANLMENLTDKDIAILFDSNHIKK